MGTLFVAEIELKISKRDKAIFLVSDNVGF